MSAPDNSKDKAPIIGLTGMRWPDNNKGEIMKNKDNEKLKGMQLLSKLIN